MALEAIRYSRGTLALLDQRRLPLESVYVPIGSAEAAHEAIKTMVVRGAPAIAIAAGLALAVELSADGAAARFGTGEQAAGARLGNAAGDRALGSVAADGRPHSHPTPQRLCTSGWTTW